MSFFNFFSRVVNVYKNIHKMLSSIEYLTDKEWKFSTENIIALRNSLLDTDSQVTIFIILKKKAKNFLMKHQKNLYFEIIFGGFSKIKYLYR